MFHIPDSLQFLFNALFTLNNPKLNDIGVEDAPVDDGYPESDRREAGLHPPGERVEEGEGVRGEIMGRHPSAHHNARVDEVMKSQKTNT